MADPRTDLPESGHLVALWTGLLLAPAAFLANLELGYLAVPGSCAGDSRLAVHLIHVACLLLSGAGLLVARREWRRAGQVWPGEAGGPEARSRFLAGLGVATSLLFGLTIVAQWVPTFALHPCQ
jgi:hypothetical protein